MLLVSGFYQNYFLLLRKIPLLFFFFRLRCKCTRNSLQIRERLLGCRPWSRLHLQEVAMDVSADPPTTLCLTIYSVWSSILGIVLFTNSCPSNKCEIRLLEIVFGYFFITKEVHLFLICDLSPFVKYVLVIFSFLNYSLIHFYSLTNPFMLHAMQKNFSQFAYLLTPLNFFH